MRHTVWVFVLLLALTASAPVLAGPGLPTLVRIDVGPYKVSLLNDSPSFKTGSNTVTVVVPGLEPEAAVSLQFVGPAGQVVKVPLAQLVVLSGPDGGHGIGDDHGARDDHGDDGHDDGAYQARGKMKLSTTGTWTAVLSIDGATEKTMFEVEQGGPNRLFLGVAGSLMGGSMIYGAIERRRQPGREV
ncbi:MAG: hypothetical protein ACOY94_24735 [Bacillota bacterium]